VIKRFHPKRALAVRQSIYRCVGVLLASVLSVQTSLWSQDPSIAVDVKVVNLPVTVRDKHGSIVQNLSKDDFILQEDGRPQSIKYFSRESNLPLTLGLLVDTSLSQRNVLDQERTASRSFLDRMLTTEKDRAFIIHFDREVELLQDLTADKDKLEKALDSINAPSMHRDPQNDPQSDPQRDPSSDPRARRGSYHGGGTQLYDAVYLASNELMKKQTGRKALIILSDGVDHGSKETLEAAIEAAQRADTLVYSILFTDPHHGETGGYGHPGGGMGRGGGYPGGGGGWPGGGYPRGGGGHRGSPYPQEAHVDGKKILQRISAETGARMFEVSKKESIDQIYASIAEELRTQYELGYVPDKSAGTGAGYHKVTLTAKEKNLTIQTRDGYYAER
jgi:VWFA-related protein